MPTPSLGTIFKYFFTENAHRLVTKSLASPLVENGHDRVDGDATAPSVMNHAQKEVTQVTSASSTPRRNRLTLHFDHTPVRNSAHFKDPPVIQSNNMYGKGSYLIRLAAPVRFQWLRKSNLKHFQIMKIKYFLLILYRTLKCTNGGFIAFY